MYSLFRYLFSSAYWRMLLRKATWMEVFLSLKRAHKDKRARKHVLQTGVLLLIPLFCLGYAAWLARTGAIFFLPFVLPVIWWRARRAKQDDEPLRIAPGPEPVRRTVGEEERRALRRYLARVALFHAVMVDRAGSEKFLKGNEVPAGSEVTSRRRHLELLRSSGIWDRMAQPDREAMMMADGHWEWDQIHEIEPAIEPQRLLRWILRVDFYLPVVGQQPAGSYAIAHELVTAPGKVIDGKGLVEEASLETAHEAAVHFHLRCAAEGISRGLYQADEEGTAWARQISSALEGKQQEDLVLRDKLVSEASDADLVWAALLAYRRVQFLEWASGLLAGGPIGERMPSLLGKEAPMALDTVEQ